MNWRSVNNPIRPAEYNYVLVADRYGAMYIARWEPETSTWITDYGEEFEDDIKYWTSIPELPK